MMAEAVKFIDGEQFLLQLQSGVVSIWKLDTLGQLIQSIESNQALYAIWSAPSTDILIIYETLVEVYCKCACPGTNVWRLLLRNSLVPKSDCNQHHFLAFNQSLLLMKEGEKSVKVLNIETGTMIEFWNKIFLSLSADGMFLVLASAETETASNIEVYSIRDAHFNAAFAGTGESLCRHITLDVPNTAIQSLSWRYNDGKTSTNTLYILLTNGLLKLYEIFNEQVIDEGAIIALAMSAAMAARSINSDIGGDGTMTPVQEPKVKTVMKPKSFSLCEVDLHERGIFKDSMRLVDLHLTFAAFATHPERNHESSNHRQGKVRESMFDAGLWIAFEQDEDAHLSSSTAADQARPQQHQQQSHYRPRLICLRQDSLHGTYRIDEGSNTSICISKPDPFSHQLYTGKTCIHATIIKDLVERLHIITHLSTQIISDVVIQRSDATRVIDSQLMFWWIGSNLDSSITPRNAAITTTTTQQVYLAEVQDVNSLAIVIKEDGKAGRLIGFVSKEGIDCDCDSSGHWVYNTSSDCNHTTLVYHNSTSIITYQLQNNQDDSLLLTRDIAGTLLDSHNNHSPHDGFTVDIIPDEQYGLGLRLDEIIDPDSSSVKVVINSFKSHPITKEPMAAEVSGKITAGDEIIGAEHLRFHNQSQASVIQAIRGILISPEHHNKPLSLLLRRPAHTAQDSGAERRNTTIRIDAEHCSSMLSLINTVKISKQGKNIACCVPFSIGSSSSSSSCDMYILAISQQSTTTILDVDKLIFTPSASYAEVAFTKALQFAMSGDEDIVCNVSKPSIQYNGDIHLTVIITSPQAIKRLMLIVSSHCSNIWRVEECEVRRSWSHLPQSLSVKSTLISQALQTFAAIRSCYLNNNTDRIHQRDAVNGVDQRVYECLMCHLTTNVNILSIVAHTISIPSSITHFNDHINLSNSQAKHPNSALIYNDENTKTCSIAELIARPLRFLEDKEMMLLRASASDFLLNKLRRKEYMESLSALDGVYYDELCPLLFGEKEVTRLLVLYAKIVLLMYEKVSSCLGLSVDTNNNGNDDMMTMTTAITQATQLEPHALTTLKLSLLQSSWQSIFLTTAKYLEDIHNEVFRRGRRKLRSYTTSPTDDDDNDEPSRSLDFSIDGGPVSNNSAKLEYVGLNTMQVSNNMFSSQQDQLFAMFIDPFNTLGLESLSHLEALRTLGKEALFLSSSSSSSLPAAASDRELIIHVNILDFLTQIKASFWLHNIEPVIQIILRHALRQFKVHKSSMLIFLELVVIGKIDLLIQLVKTDFSSSGKQLLTLLLFVDEAFNPFNQDENKVNNCITKLRKNAFALIRKQRYRDAIAVLLLIPTQAMVKSAVSLLTKQYNDPYLAYLIVRCLESRLYVHHKVKQETAPGTSSISQPKLEKLIIQESIKSNLEDLQNRVGLVHGYYNYLLVTEDIIPMLLNDSNTSDENNNNLTRLQSLLQALIAALWTQNLDLMKKIFDLLLAHLKALDLPSKSESVVAELKQMIQHSLHHDFSSDDVDLVFRFMTYTYGNFSDTTTVMQLLFPALTFLEEYSMFMDFPRIGKLHLATIKLLKQLSLTQGVLRKQQEFSQLTPLIIQQRVKNNAFFTFASECRDTYKDNWNTMQKEQQAAIAASNQAAALATQAAAVVDTIKATEETQQQPKVSMFNFAASSNKPSGATKKKAASTRSLLDDDDFIAPPPQPRTANKSALDMFDPPASPQQTSAAPRSALDDFDNMPAVVRRPVKKAQIAAPSEAVDIFDMTPTTRNKR